MGEEELKLRTRAQELHDKNARSKAETNEMIKIRSRLIEISGWSRGKSLGNNRYSYMER